MRGVYYAWTSRRWTFVQWKHAEFNMQDLPAAEGATVNLFKRSQAAIVLGYV